MLGDKSGKPAQRGAYGEADPSTFVRAICNYPGQRTKLHDFLTQFEKVTESVAPFANGRGKRGGKLLQNPASKVTVKKYMEKIVSQAMISRRFVCVCIRIHVLVYVCVILSVFMLIDNVGGVRQGWKLSGC